MRHFNSNHRNLLAAMLLAFVLSSCVPQKKMLYLQDAAMKADNISQVYNNDRSLNYKLQPGDNLYIRAVNVIDERNTALFNGETGYGRTQLSNDASVYLSCYNIDANGCIELPMVGIVEVKDLTVEEAKNKLQTALNQYVKETLLIVKLANFNLTVLGEVNHPGSFKVYQSQINLFEAISMAGNTTNFAKRNDIKIIRQTETGSEIITVDLEKADILSSPYYYLKPNDIVYVEPLKIKQWGFTSFPYSTVISVITLGITLFTLLRK